MRIHMIAVALALAAAAPAAAAPNDRPKVPLNAILATSWWPPRRNLPETVWARDLQLHPKDAAEIRRRQDAVNRQLARMARAGLLGHGSPYAIAGRWSPPIGVNITPTCNERRGPIVDSMTEFMLERDARMRQTPAVTEVRLFGDADGFDAARREVKKIERKLANPHHRRPGRSRESRRRHRG